MEEIAHVLLSKRVSDWLYREAELLDSMREASWLETMVSKSIVYQAPLRQTVRRESGAGFIKGAFHFDETYGSLKTRFARHDTGYGWADDPPSRARHFISNVRVVSASSAEVEVKSNLLLCRNRGDSSAINIMTAERHDLLKTDGDNFLLARRIVYLDASVIETPNLSVIF